MWLVICVGSLVFSKPVFAQGTFTCTCSGSGGFQCPSWTVFDSGNQCEINYSPDVTLCYHAGYCDQNQTSCTINCISDTSAPFPDGYFTCSWDADSSSCSLFPSHHCEAGFVPTQACQNLIGQQCTSAMLPCVPGEETCGRQLGAPCCPDFSCGQGLYCDMDVFTCKACGLTGNQCCPPPGPLCLNGGTCSESNICEPAPGLSENLMCSENEINTAIGCISIGDINKTTLSILTWSIGIAGGVFLILAIYASLTISTSSGNPRKLRAGQELMLSALAGLIMLLFSIFILRVIGVDILGILQ